MANNSREKSKKMYGNYVFFVIIYYRLKFVLYPSGTLTKEEFNMRQTNSQRMSTKTMVTAAVMTAIVILLQCITAGMRAGGMFTFTLALIPIVIGGATLGKLIGTWLGFVFGVTVILTGDAAAFMAISIPGTIVTVLAKGALCGFFAALIFQIFSKLTKGNVNLSAIVAGIACPVANTGVFLLGCLLFFMPKITEWAAGKNVGLYMITGLVGLNFFIELASCIIIFPAVARIIKIVKR